MSSPWPGRMRQAIDAIVYALAVAALVAAASLLAATVAFDDTSSGVVLLTFLAGWLTLGYGILQLWPRAARRSTEHDEGVDPTETRIGDVLESADSREETAFQSAVQAVPPLRWYSLPPDQRLPDGVKTLLAGVVVLAVSLGIDFIANW